MAKKQHFDNETGGWIARFSAHEVHEDASELRVETLLSRFFCFFFPPDFTSSPFSDFALPRATPLRCLDCNYFAIKTPDALSLDSSKSYLLDGSFFLRKEK
jgi:hypothetical protein